MDVTLGLGSLLGGIASGFGSYFSGQNQLDATRETNAQNYKIWQEQMAHNVDMYEMERSNNIYMHNLQRSHNIADWIMQQEYNTPSAQRQRLEEAGLNPYMMMNGGSAGVASSAPYSANMGSASVNPSQAPTMQTAHPSAFIDPVTTAVEKIVTSFEGLNIGLNQGEQAQQTETTTPSIVQNIDADTDNKKADTDNKKADTDNKKADTDKKVAETTGISIDNSYKDLFNSVNYDLLDKEAKLKGNKLTYENTTFSNKILANNLHLSNLTLDNNIKSLSLQFMPAETFANLELIASQIGLNVANREMSYAQARKYISDVALNSMIGGYYGELSRGLKMDNDVREFGLQDEKSTNQYFWNTQKRTAWYENDVRKDFNTAYSNKKYGIINTKTANYLGTMLLNNTLNNLKLQGIDFDFDLDYKGSSSYQLMRWIGNSGREGFSGYSLPSLNFNSKTYNSIIP